MLSCITCGKQFEYSDKHKALRGRIGIPDPNECFACRTSRKLCFRNERTLYQRNCGLCNRSVITIYNPQSPITVYCQTCWWSDKWDPTTFGVDYDPNKSFFEQYRELQKKVPHIALMNRDNENSEFCNYTVKNKNCYLVFGGDYNDNTYYSTFSTRCVDVAESYWAEKCERCYEITDSKECYNTIFAKYCIGCMDSWFLEDCQNCSNCFGCVGLRNKKYHIFNKQHSQKEYKEKIDSYQLGTNEGFKKAKNEYYAFRLTQPHPFARLVSCQNVTGDDVYNCNEMENSFDFFNGCTNIFDSMLGELQSKDCSSNFIVYDNCELVGETMGVLTGYHLIGGNIVWNDRDVYYSHFVLSSNDCLGCISLNKKQYCILNKQYTKEKYEQIKNEIIEKMKKNDEWGRYFPRNLSPFGYNESAAMDYFPMNKVDSAAVGYNWCDSMPSTKGKETVSQNSLSKNIIDVEDSITSQILACVECGKNYKIIKAELELYRKMFIPVPDRCPLCRHYERMGRRNQRNLYHRECACKLKGHDNHKEGQQCTNKFETTYAPERKEIIWCDVCYKKEIY